MNNRRVVSYDYTVIGICFSGYLPICLVNLKLLFLMQEMWIGVIHHVCGEHEWENGQCSHGQLTEVEEGKQILAKDSKAAKELRKIVFDAQWLKYLQHYVKFRYVLPIWMQNWYNR